MTGEQLREQWIEGEDNSPYGVDEHGTKIPMRDGKQCADELGEFLARLRKLSSAAEYAALGHPEEVKLRKFIEQLDAAIGDPWE